MKLQAALSMSIEGRALTRAQAREVFASALSEPSEPAQLGGFLASLATRGETAQEIAGAVDALRAVMVPFEHDCPQAIDTCGTGGDGLETFNLSTAAALVAAAAGARVIKHGNRSLSSRCGSADLLERLGIPLELSPRAARHVLEETGITFLFAPLYHPSLRQAGPVRRALGVRTVFNLLGPLANPGRVSRQLLGTSDARRLPQIADVLRELRHERALVIHGAGGADELTLSGENLLVAVGPVSAQGFQAGELGLTAAPVRALEGGDPDRNAELLDVVLRGEPGPLFDAVLLNASAALVVAGVSADARSGLETAREALRSRAAARKLEEWRRVAQSLGRAP
jgi:anthranilate phosphoribosyltransferase